nr:MAG TPA: hypothetical protein [Caudoviricetes sp.]
MGLYITRYSGVQSWVSGGRWSSVESPEISP